MKLMVKIDKSGFSQIFILLVILVGIAITVWGVQYGRTVLQPKASEEGNVNPLDLNHRACVGSPYITCEQTSVGKRAVRIREAGGTAGEECTIFRDDLGDCDYYLCPDNECYYDKTVNQWIHKSGGYEENNDCVYDYKKYSTEQECKDARRAIVDQRLSEGYLSPAKQGGTTCKPGETNSQYCTICNEAGTGWMRFGSEWGDYDAAPAQWCGCARQYSYSTQGKAFSQDNYPQCY